MQRRQTLGPVAACANHSDREALGICVRCSKLVCSECVTRVDGINHCVGCLADAGKGRSSVAPPPDASSAGPAARLVLLCALLAIGLWGILEATLPG
ncbi:MAG: hypothetical protein HYY06_03415 [Deltaproteobacteria bacterium]|nr:hypothetical protein [Deltaproteobacteria bacterium]